SCSYCRNRSYIAAALASAGNGGEPARGILRAADTSFASRGAPAGNLRCSTLSNAALLCSLILFTICWKRCNCERNCIFVIRSAFAAISSACSLGNGRAFCCCFLASDGFLTVCVLGFMACLSFFC